MGLFRDLIDPQRWDDNGFRSELLLFIIGGSIVSLVLILTI
jgi:hypothetical protein